MREGEKVRKKEKNGAVSAHIVLFVISAMLTVGAALLLRGMVVRSGLTARILSGVGGVLCTVVGALGWLVLIAAIVSGGHRNIFLYDKKSRTELPLDALDWELVRSRLGEYVRLYLRSGRRGYLPLPLQPLLMPYLLLVFIDSAPDSDWNKLFGEENAILREMIDGLSRFGLAEPSRILSEAASRYRGNPGPVKLALARQRASVEGAILSHIREHINEYEM